MNQAIQLKEKIGYGFGDFASSMFWKIFCHVPNLLLYRCSRIITRISGVNVYHGFVYGMD